MLISEKLAFVELHKGGSARVQKLIGEIGGGEVLGKVPTFANELAALNKPVIGYLCDPLAWYLNLWKMGCAERGELFRRMTDRSKWSSLLAKRAARLKGGSAPATGKAIPEGWGAERALKVWYAKTEEPEAFREWLQAVVATRGIRRLVHQTFANSPLQRLGGLLTYEYFLSFVRDSENLDKSVDSPEKLKALNEQKCITPHFIKAETSGADFLRIMGELGMVMTDGQQHTVAAWDKDHEAFREHEFNTYYDAASRRLVLKRERFICEAFGYHVGATGDAGDVEDDDEDGDGDKPAGKGKAGKGGMGKGGAGKGKNKAAGAGAGSGGGMAAKKAGKKKAGGGGGGGSGSGDGDEDGEDKPKLTPEQRAEKREARKAAKVEARQAAGASGEAGGAGEGEAEGEASPAAAKKTAARKEKSAARAASKTSGQTEGKAAGKSAGKSAAGKSASGKTAGAKSTKSAEKTAARKQTRTAARKAAKAEAADAAGGETVVDATPDAGSDNPVTNPDFDVNTGNTGNGGQQN